MSLITAIYDRLSSSTDLAALLASNPLDQAPAIYETWALEDTEMPYVVQTIEKRRGNHFAKTDALAIFDIFTDAGTVNAEAICNRIIKELDQAAIEVENTNAARFYYNSDQNVGDPEPEIVHWQITFDVQYWRKNWIEYHNEVTNAPATEDTATVTTTETTTETATDTTTETATETTTDTTTETTTDTTTEGTTIQEHAKIMLVTQYESSPYVLATKDFLIESGNEVTIGSYVDFDNYRIDFTQYDLAAFLLYPSLTNVYDKISELENSGTPVIIGYSSPMTGYLPYIGATEDIEAANYSNSVIVNTNHYITSVYTENATEIFKDEGTAIYQYPAAANFAGESLVEDTEGNKLVIAMDENTTFLNGYTTTSKILAYGLLTTNYNKEAERQLLQRSIQWLIS